MFQMEYDIRLLLTFHILQLPAAKESKCTAKFVNSQRDEAIDL